MKTNLDIFFKTNKKIEQEEGIDFEYGPAKFRCKRFGGYNAQSIKAALATEYKPFARQIEMETLAEEKEREIAIKIFVKSSLIGWSGVVIDDKEQEFSHDAAVKLFLSLPDLYTDLAKQASDSKNYRVDLGNF